MIALVLGTLIAVGALAYVLAPLFRDEDARPRSPEPSAGGSGVRVEEGAGAIEALREIEFDRATGKLSDDDYAALKADYTQRALTAMRADEAGAPVTPVVAGSTGGDAEASTRRHRAAAPSCAQCGPRPEPDAVYCSSCGRFLAGKCDRCGADVTEPGAHFCAGCGGRIGAMTIGRAAVA